MAIINIPFPYIDSTGPVDYRDSAIIFQFRSFDDTDYFYIEFKDEHSFTNHTLDTIIPAGILARIRDGAVMLALVNSHEAFHSVVEGIYKHIVTTLKVPARQILLLSGSADIGAEVKKVATTFRQGEIRVEWMREFEFAITRISDRPKIKLYEKKFLNLNRRWRLHRPAFVAFMAIRGLLSKGYVSLAKSDDGQTWRRSFPNILSQHSGYPVETKLLTDNSSLILSLPDMYVDTRDLETNRAHPEESLSEFTNNTYFSIVSETNYYSMGYGYGRSPGRFFSEKTFKSIADMHPLVLLAPPHSLKALRELGYKTFSPLINENYDLEVDDNKRMQLVLDEVERLCSLDAQALTHFLYESQKICMFNYAVFILKQSSPLTPGYFITKLN